MKYHKKRRFGALVLALAMALSLVAPGWADDPDTGDTTSPTLTIDPSSPTLKPGESVELTAKLEDGPTDGTTVTYTWSCETDGVSVESSNNDDKATVTVDSSVTVTSAKITVSADWGGLDTPLSCDYTLTITQDSPPPVETDPVESDPVESDPGTSDPPSPTTANTVIFPSGAIVWTITQTNPWDLTVSAGPAGTAMATGDTIKWSASNKDTTKNTEEFLPKLSPRDGTQGRTVRINNQYPGEYTFSATYVKADGTESEPVLKDVTISGITLNEREIPEGKLMVGGSMALSVEHAYGAAAGGTVRDIVWTSSDPSIVTVLNGDLMAWNTGTVVITANKNGYTAECTVTVGEDKAAIVGPYPATTGSPLIFKNASQTFNGQTFNVYQDLNTISRTKTAELGDDGEPNISTGSPLRYITNVSVPTDQGTLYYNYNSEANTGEGVGMTDTFRDASVTDSSVTRTLDLLYFVPRQGFTGTAEITFTGRAQDGTIFSGIIRVNVTGLNYISYRTNTGEAVNFLSGDFNSFCRSKLGRDVNYVTFNLPQASQGTLYYNYTASGQYGDRVTTSTQYSRSGRYLIDEVSFVPNDAFIGDATISFRGVDTAGNAFTGEVVISVSPGSTETDVSNVYISGERGQPVALQSDLFNDACRATIRDTLSYVIFKLPDYSDGTLYYNYRGADNYDSRVTATTRYYYSGVPGINGVSFVPASNNTGRVAIPFTGYGTGGTTFTGTLYITIGETDRTTVRYFVSKNGSINFDASDFNNACLLQLGVSLDYVRFQLPNIDPSVGRLYYNYRSSSSYSGVYSNFSYYRDPKQTYQGRIGLISFHAGTSAGTITIPYTAYATTANASTAPQTYQGAVVIQVGSPTPAEVNLTCKTAGQARLSSYSLSSVCRPVMNGSLSYIEITSIPDPEKGRLYSNYTGFGTGTEVKQGDRFYCLGGPNIDQVCFVPHAGFTGQVELTYIGFSSNGQEQVSGRILVNVSQTTQSSYFNDMGSYVWAIDSVDYLYWNRAVQGVGDGRYNPRGNITKGDFTLMLVRAFGFTATGSVSYKDVPANSYYAEAIRIAGLLGIGSSSNGNYYPNVRLSRQDAMVMIRNALVADGRTLTNGLAANLDGYHDENLIAAYARAAVGSLVQMGIVKGDGNGYLRPTALLNRAEAAMLLHTLMTL